MGILLSFNFLALDCWLYFYKVCMGVFLHQRAPGGRGKPLNPEQQAAVRVRRAPPALGSSCPQGALPTVGMFTCCALVGVDTRLVVCAGS